MFGFICMSDVIKIIYDTIFGINPNLKATLFLIGILPEEIEAYRDCGIEYKNSQIWLFTRTGETIQKTENSNQHLLNNPFLISVNIDTFDKTYEWYLFKIPPAKIEEAKKLKCERKKPDLRKFVENASINLDRKDVKKAIKEKFNLPI